MNPSVGTKLVFRVAHTFHNNNVNSFSHVSLRCVSEIDGTATPRDPPPSWATPASRRNLVEASIHYRRFSGEYEFRVPTGDVFDIAHRVLQGNQELQMRRLQIQEYECQMGLLQAQNRLYQMQFMSQCLQVMTSPSLNLPKWAVSEYQSRVEDRIDGHGHDLGLRKDDHDRGVVVRMITGMIWSKALLQQQSFLHLRPVQIGPDRPYRQLDFPLPFLQF